MILLKNRGTVLRLPLYLCVLNAMAPHNTTYKLSDIKQLIEKVVSEINTVRGVIVSRILSAKKISYGNLTTVLMLSSWTASLIPLIQVMIQVLT